ncbi:MAG: hypothetical protein V1678_04530 [Candidatus Aenigmatarchaeota archaeon]
MNKEILELSKKLYLEGKSTREVSELILQECGTKVNFEVIRRNLKKLGIMRDNSACQKIVKRRHLSLEEIIRLYTQENLSLKKLAKRFISNKKTIHKILEEGGIKIRTNDEAIILANRRHNRIPFDGNQYEKAYMTGLTHGDITPLMKSKFTLRLTSGTTRLSFVDLFRDTFERYGPIYVYADKKSAGNSLRLTVDLDTTFRFLLDSEVKLNRNNSFSYVAGLVDSDGSIFIRKSGKYFQYVFRIYNEDLPMLTIVKNILEMNGFMSNLQLFSKKGERRLYGNKSIVYNNDYYAVEITKRDDVLKLLSKLPLRHKERVSWKEKMKLIHEKKLIYWNDIEKDVLSLRNFNENKYQLNRAESSLNNC